MPYQAGNRLPGERASRIGHLEVLKSPLVRQLCESFQKPEIPLESKNLHWQPIESDDDHLKYVFGVDGSTQIIRSDVSPYSTIGFVKTALLKLDDYALSKVDRDSPHPYVLRDILQDSAIYHATAFPLRNISVPGLSNYHAIREILFESINDNSPEMEGQIMETFKWLAYQKWTNSKDQLTSFECPHCHSNYATLPFDAIEGSCPHCDGHLYITDWLGFHQEMGEEAAQDTIATTYMNIHETLLLFTAIRSYWEKKTDILSQCLFVKDGPLSIRAQYSKLVEPIRRFLAFARDQGRPIHILGQEKSGRFFDHFQYIGNEAPCQSLFIPNDSYIKTQIQNRPLEGAEYGKDTNYGAKVFVKWSEYHKLVLNIPFGEFNANPKLQDLIGYKKIFSTLPKILSNRHEGALLPIELAHGIASLSTYPSAKILKLFAESGRNYKEMGY
ncbi:MAG TPA: hypothetical protein PLN56_11705 [Methanoregulaceae archaeon]|nr:hypothetical protein [Methanolinea sp.]HPD11646.1 hypothetical protein [Methanoregulaceae archaeon]HRU80809.1 hypothetical protein [Methanolinea sp.]